MFILVLSLTLSADVEAVPVPVCWECSEAIPAPVIARPAIMLPAIRPIHLFPAHQPMMYPAHMPAFGTQPRFWNNAAFGQCGPFGCR